MDSDNSSDELSSLMETINQCIDRDSDWKDYYNEKMDEICESSENRSSIYTVLLEERLCVRLRSVRQLRGRMSTHSKNC